MKNKSLIFPDFFSREKLTQKGLRLLDIAKGQLISKCFFGVFNFFQKTNENKSTWGIIVVNLNLFVRFLEETLTWKNHFDFVWPLHGYKFPSGKSIYFTFMKPLSKLPCNITTWSSGPWLILFHHCSAVQYKGTYSAVSFDGPFHAHYCCCTENWLI